MKKKNRCISRGGHRDIGGGGTSIWQCLVKNRLIRTPLVLFSLYFSSFILFCFICLQISINKKTGLAKTCMFIS